MTKKRAYIGLRLHWMHLEFQKALEKVRNNEVMWKAKDCNIWGWARKLGTGSQLFSLNWYHQVAFCLLPAVCTPVCEGKQVLSMAPCPFYTLIPPLLTLPSHVSHVSCILTPLHTPLFIQYTRSFYIFGFYKRNDLLQKESAFPEKLLTLPSSHIEQLLYCDIHWVVIFDVSASLPSQFEAPWVQGLWLTHFCISELIVAADI